MMNFIKFNKFNTLMLLMNLFLLVASIRADNYLSAAGHVFFIFLFMLNFDYGKYKS